MKSICVNSGEMGYACFEKMHELGGDIRALVPLDTQRPDRRSGQVAFETLAEQIGAPRITCRNINDQSVLDALAEIAPDLFVDIEKALDVKIAAMKQCTTELRDYPHPRSIEGIRVFAARDGASVGVRFAEPF